MNRIFLIGLPGSGKTTLAKKSSERFGIPSLDLDEQFALEYGVSPGESILKKGEKDFREKETALLNRILLEDFLGIISVGGGAPSFGSNMEKMLASGSVIFLDVDLFTLESRIKKEKEIRPWLTQNPDIGSSLASLDKERRPFYTKAPTTLSSSILEDQLSVLEKYCSR